MGYFMRKDCSGENHSQWLDHYVRDIISSCKVHHITLKNARPPLTDPHWYLTYSWPLAEPRGESTNRNRSPEVEPTRHRFLLAESKTQPKMQHGGGPADYFSKVAKIRQFTFLGSVTHSKNWAANQKSIDDWDEPGARWTRCMKVCGAADICAKKWMFGFFARWTFLSCYIFFPDLDSDQPAKTETELLCYYVSSPSSCVPVVGLYVQWPCTHGGDKSLA